MNYLTKKDYISILKYYNIQMNEDTPIEDIKHKAETILASKLCKCIKKIDNKPKNESRAIALCRNAVIQKKGFDIFKFTCKNKSKLIPKKNTKTRLVKINKINKINKSKKK